MPNIPNKPEKQEKQRFPLGLIPAPRGWNLTITPKDGEVHRLIKPGRSSEPNIPCLFTSQNEAWSYIKERFSLILLSCQQTDDPLLEKFRNCKQCDRIFRAKLQEFCAHCQKDNEFVLQQLWKGFQLETDTEFTVPQKVRIILNSTEEDFTQIPELFKTHVQQPLAEEDEAANGTPNPARQLSRIIRSRMGHSSRRRRAH